MAAFNFLHFVIAGELAALSLLLLLWQWLAARRFPLHQRAADLSFAPPVTLLKPLKQCGQSTRLCLRSWLTQDYAGEIQVLFAVHEKDEPSARAVRELIAEFPRAGIELVVCAEVAGQAGNPKVCKLIELERRAQHEILIVSDADVRVPQHLVANLVAPLRNTEVGLVNCFYRMAHAEGATLAMGWEAVAVNVDFWSQVLQARTLKPLDFALGAVMAIRREDVSAIGGFAALKNCLADDYQLGHRIVRPDRRIELSPVVVECVPEKMGWGAVWKHQLRWARTIRVCAPMPYFLSILSNPTLWPLIWAIVNPGPISATFLGACLLARVILAWDLERRLAGPRSNAGVNRRSAAPMAPIKDMLQCALWFCAFAGNRVEWQGQTLRLKPDGTVTKVEP